MYFKNPQQWVFSCPFLLAIILANCCKIAIMADTVDVQDLTALEKKAGQKAAAAIRRNLKLELSGLKKTGLQLQMAGAGINMKFDQLDAITVKATDATFKQHYGFEGIKSNGVRIKMRSFSHFDKVLSRGSALEVLLTEIGNIRLDKVTRNIRF